MNANAAPPPPGDGQDASSPSLGDGNDTKQERLAEAREELRGSLSGGGKSVRVLAVLAVFATLYAASAILLPFALAIVLFLLLSPAMRLLTRRVRLPRFLAALLLVLALLALVGGVGAAISVPAAGWVAKAPQALPMLQKKLAFLSGPIGMAQDGYKHVAEALGQKPDSGGGGGGGSGIFAVGGSILMRFETLLADAFTVLLLVFFMLSAGDTLMRRVVEVLPSWDDKKRMVTIAGEIEDNIGHYLATITVMNALVGVVTGTAMWLLGLGDGLLWGTFAFLLNYIPIMGPAIGVVCFLLVGLLTYDTPLFALVPAGVYGLIHVLEGETVTPMLLARRLTLNPLLVIVSLFFWEWMWGVTGALLSVPLLAIAKIVCDRMPGLVALGHLLGSEGDENTPSKIADNRTAG